MTELPLNALRAFAVVHAEGGVRAAARRLGVAHSSVSRHLKELEAWLGRALLEPRSGRGGRVFTPEGETLGRATGAGFGEIERVTSALRDVRAPNAATISVTPSLASRWLLARLAQFEADHPKIQVSVVVDQRLDDLSGGGIDLAIRMGRGEWPELRSEPLMDDELYPVMSPSLWAKVGRPREPAQLVGLKLLHDRDPHASWKQWRDAHGPAALAIERGATFTSSDLVLRAAALSQGVALARHRLVTSDLESGALMRPFAQLSVKLGTAYWVVLPKHSRVRPVVMTVLGWLKRQGRT